MYAVGVVIHWILWIFILLLIVRLVVDWIQVFARQWQPHGAALVILEGVYSATDPPIKAFRKTFKPIRMGGVALDVSFLMVMVICYILLYLNDAILLR